MSILTIAIPTYNREEVLWENLQNSKLGLNPHVEIMISSNGIMRDSKRFCELGCKINEFAINQGAAANFLYLLQNVQSEFVMLMSDEDFIDFGKLDAFVNFLVGLDRQFGVILPGVVEPHSSNFIFPPLKRSYNLRSFILAGLPARTYVTGFVYRVEALKKIPLDEIFEQRDINGVAANVYGQNNTLIQILNKGYLVSGYPYKFIFKGIDAGFGGDSHSHGEAGLNPAFYSVKARREQLRYQLKRNRILDIKYNMRLLLNLHTRIFYLRAILRAKIEGEPAITNNNAYLKCLKKSILKIGLITTKIFDRLVRL